MSTFYTNVKQYGNNILFRGIKNGKRVQAKVPYRPSLFLPTNEESKYKTIYGENLVKKRFDTIKESRQFVDQYRDVENFNIYGNTKYEYCFISEVYKTDIEWDFSKVRICIFDIEVNSDPDKGGFASPEDPHQPIISIALKFVGDEASYLLGYHDFDAPKNVHYYKCKDEWTLLKTFIEIWSLDYPDVISGWNIGGFDVKYLVNRCNKIIGEQETKKLSPWKVIKEKKTRKFNPKFNQYEEDVEYSLLGISSLDYMDLFKKYHPEGKSQESYKLDHIAENEIGENKVEYDGSLHKLYTEDKNKFYLYNLQDIYLIEKINDKCRLFELGLTLAYDSKTNPEDIFFQTIMWDVLIYNFLNKRNIQLPQNKQSESQDYAGAYVKSPQTGMHKWVVSLDATSLYPSVIIGKNISPETLVPIEDYSVNMRNVMSSGVNVENLLSRSINLDFLKEDNVTITPNGQFFRTDKKGFLPEMIEKMFADRQTYKKKMIQAQKDYEVISSEYNKTNSDELKTRMEELEYDISKFNNLQNSKKLCLNSAYGALGAKQFRLFDTRLAEAITLEGQLSNRWVANGINVFFNSLLKTDSDYVIYGDSVADYTPVYTSTIKSGKRVVDVLKIDELAEKYGNNNWIKGENGKESCELENVETWTDKGWSKLFRVIRHELSPDKKMIRVLTHTGCVDVTDDHSLLRKNGEETSPNDLSIGEELLHNNLPLFEISENNITEEEAKIMGFFFGDGSCGHYDCLSGKKASWALNNSNLVILNEYKTLCELVYPDFSWVINDTIRSSGVYKLVPKSNGERGKILDFVLTYRKLMYSEKSKIIPMQILCSNDNVKRAFFDGLYHADGCKMGSGTRIDQKSQISSSFIFLLAKNLGYSVSMRTRIDKQNIYSLIFTNGKQKRNPNAVKKMYEIDYSGFVYDLTTENNHFAAGVGNMIVHNTDSLIISFEDLVNKVCKNDVDPNKIANSLLKLIDNKIQPAVDSFCLELKEYVNSYKNSLSYKLEKICSTGIFVAKKRYALNVFSNEGVIYSEPKIKVTGMEIVKSSTPSIVRDSLKQCIKIMMNEDEDSLQNYVSLFKNKFSSYDVEEISFPRGVNGLNKYFDTTTLYKKGTPIHVRGSILFNKLLDDKKLSSEYEYIKDGDKIKFCYLKMPNIIKENVIAFPEKLPKEFDLLENVDYNKMYDKVFLEPLKAITEVIGWEIEKRNRMEDFF